MFFLQPEMKFRNLCNVTELSLDIQYLKENTVDNYKTYSNESF